MSKSEALFKDLKKAYRRLKEACKLSQNAINQDATIKRFEFTFELSWKLMQSIARDNDIEVYGVKSVIREAAKLGLIEEPKIWFEFLKDRNLTTHTYKEEIADKVYKKAKEFVDYAKNLLTNAEGKL